MRWKTTTSVPNAAKDTPMESTKRVISAGKRCGFITKITMKTSWKVFENSGLNTEKKGCVFTVIALRNMEKVCVRFTQKEKECGI